MGTAERKYWSILNPMRPAAETAAAALAAEDAGLEGCFSIQLQSNPFVPLAAAAVSTARVRLGTGIALGFTRSPYETALAAMELDVMSGGRFTLGLGTSVRAWHEDLYGVDYDPPVARLAEAIQIIRLFTSGQAAARERFEGRFWRLDFTRSELRTPLRPDLPIWVAALRSPLCRVAGQYADGLIGHPSWSLDWAKLQVNGRFAEGLAASGRTRSQVEVNLWLCVAPNPDRAESVHDAKRQVARYASIAQYEAYYGAHGYFAEARALQAAAAARQRDLASLVPDEMAKTFVVTGTPGDVAEQIEPLWEVADSLVLQPPPVPREQFAAYQTRIADTFYG
ncbi:MAG: LLM class flavin-dependent oxidoreductase [Acidimicrobiales bacterium]